LPPALAGICRRQRPESGSVAAPRFAVQVALEGVYTLAGSDVRRVPNDRERVDLAAPR
jgi:hypothetical protein